MRAERSNPGITVFASGASKSERSSPGGPLDTQVAQTNGPNNSKVAPAPRPSLQKSQPLAAHGIPLKPRKPPAGKKRSRNVLLGILGGVLAVGLIAIVVVAAYSGSRPDPNKATESNNKLFSAKAKQYIPKEVDGVLVTNSESAAQELKAIVVANSHFSPSDVYVTAGVVGDATGAPETTVAAIKIKRRDQTFTESIKDIYFANQSGKHPSELMILDSPAFIYKGHDLTDREGLVGLAFPRDDLAVVAFKSSTKTKDARAVLKAALVGGHI